MLITKVTDEDVDVVSCDTDSHQEVNNEATNLNVQPDQDSPKPVSVPDYRPIIDYKPVPVAFGRMIWDCS